MKYNQMLISAIVITLFNTGCVKPTEEINNTDNSKNRDSTAAVYDEQPNSVSYDDSQPIIYADPTATTNNNDVTYNSGDNSVITTPTESYQPAMGASTVGGGGTSASRTPSASDHYQPTDGGRYSSASTSGAYSSDPYSSGSSGGGYTPVDDPYASSSSSSSSRNGYSTNIPYSSSSSSHSYGSSSSGKGIHLQVAALRDYYAAEEFRKGLSLPPKYTSYIKRGSINKVIVKGFGSRAEAKALAARQFPGAFIVSGSSSSGSSHTRPSHSSSSHSSSYGSSSSHSSHGSSSSSANSKNGIGVQVGAFSSKSKARAVAQEKAGGKYTAIVKTVKSKGRTIYKAIILGFANRADAKQAIASGRFGNAFVVTGIHQ